MLKPRMRSSWPSNKVLTFSMTPSVVMLWYMYGRRGGWRVSFRGFIRSENEGVAD